jgi:hypothetical protein
MKAAGIPGNTELLRSQVFTGLLLGTLPHIPQPGPRPGDGGPSDTEGPQGPADPGHTGNPSGPSPSGPGDADAPEDPADPSHTGDPSHFADPSHTGDPSHSAGSDTTGPGGTGRGRQGPPGGDGASDSSGTGPVRCDHAAPVTDHTGPEPARTDRWTRNPPEGGGRAGSSPSWPMLPMPGGATAPGCAGIPAGLGPPAGKLRLAVPWRTLMGLAPEPGRLCWVGPVTPQTAREIAAAAAADPACIQARDITCRSPVCRQPARHCDADHTIPYDKGGRTCRCNLGNTCRSHHQLKQLPGWTLEHPSPGIFTWRTPSGLSYTVPPDRHPI